jgi:hypothetical protein
MAKSDMYRVKFVIDEQARFEECNGEPRPLTEAEYAENQYRACPKHPRGSTLPARTENGRAWCGDCGTEYADVPYADYLEYQGNPDRHVYLGVIVEKKCKCCGTWTNAASLWHIDFMDDDRAYQQTNLDHWYEPDVAGRLPDYAGEVAREQLEEAGYKFPKPRKAR